MEIGTVKLVNIEEEMRGAYLDYAMSVITARALPDVRDGLKPVQRRILYAMDELGLRHSSPYKKSARIVGEVLGKYHPHGDAPVYEAMVRLAQDFSMRYPLIDGQGNFGSVDGDPPAAMRYTEARMAAIAEEMLADIDKNTVDLAANFDGTLKEPTVLPAKMPNLLLNGSSGIAVGMATNIPPHNLNEVVDAIVLMIGHFGQCLEAGIPFEVIWPRVLNANVAPEALAGALKSIKPDLARRVKDEAAKLAAKPTDETRADALLNVVDEMIDIPPDRILEAVKGPDFPTAGIILGGDGIKNAYVTGHGRIVIRAKAHVEEMRGNRHQIIVTQLPYQVNKASLLEKIADLVRDRRIEGISELRDESDRQGMRIVIELRRDTRPTQILNQLFKYTSMQTAFSINLLALVDGQPRVLTLKMMLLHFINYRKEIITRRTIYDLERARHRAHILQGLKIALDNLDEVIATIRKSRDAEAARGALMKGFKLTEIQAQAILDMQLRRLAALERKKILDELAETLKLIEHLEDLLAHPGKMLFIIRDELRELKEKYGDARRTRIAAEAVEEFSEEDLIPDQEIAITVSAKGYVKRMAADSFRVSRRAKAIAGTVAREEDAPQTALIASTLDQVLFITNRGRAYQIKAHELPDTGRQARGLPLSNFFTLQPEERPAGVVAVRNFDQPWHVVFVTRKGDVKRVALSEYSSARSSGIAAISLGEGDEIVFVGLTDGKNELMVFSEDGQAIRFGEDEVRVSGRTSGGMRAIRLKEGDRVAAGSVVSGDNVVIVTQNGFHKRCSVEEFPVQGRGGGGVRAQTVTAKTGPVAGAAVAREGDEILIVSAGGLMLRSPVDTVPVAGRATQGTPLAGLEKSDKVATVWRIEAREAPTKQTSPPAPDGGEPSSAATGKAGGKGAGGGAKSSAKPRRAAKGTKAAEQADLEAGVAAEEMADVKTSAKSKSKATSGKAASGNTDSGSKGAATNKSATAQTGGSKVAASKSARSKEPAPKAAPEKSAKTKETGAKPAKPHDTKSKAATSKVAIAKAATTKETAARPKSSSTVKPKKEAEPQPDERFTRRIVIAPPAAKAPAAKKAAQGTTPEPAKGTVKPAAAPITTGKGEKSKPATLWSSITSTVTKSSSGVEKKDAEGKRQKISKGSAAQPALPAMDDGKQARGKETPSRVGKGGPGKKAALPPTSSASRKGKAGTQ